MSETDYKAIVDRLRKYCYDNEKADIHEILNILDGEEEEE